MSNCTSKVGSSSSVSVTSVSNVAISQHQIVTSLSETQPFIGSFLWRKHFAKDGPAPRNEDGMVIGRDT